MRKIDRIVALSLLFALGLFFSTAYAKDDKKAEAPKKNTQQAKRGPEHRAEIHHFHGHDYRHWNAHDRGVWRGGRWRHVRYHGRLGYWWVVGGMWYFYETMPPGPYPAVLSDFSLEAPPMAAPVVVQEPPLQVQAQPRSWYLCDNPKGYSPYITSCPGGWHSVPAQGPGQPPPPE